MPNKGILLDSRELTASVPQLLYDGDCAYCRYCVGYARAVTGAQVVYRPYQVAAAEFPQVSRQQCRDAIQLFEGADHHSGAAAGCRLLAIGKRPLWYFLYRHLPLFAWVAERLYQWLARHRNGCLRLSRLCWGEHWRPLGYERTTWLFLRGLALVYLAAFASLGVQILGLVGSAGIAPLVPYLEAVTAQQGWQGILWTPSVFWLSAADGWLQWVPWLGVGCALLLLFNRVPRTSLCLSYCFYLSLVHAGQLFTRYQWDLLLLEASVLALVLMHWQQVGVWLMRWLLLRLLLLSGVVKILSGDSSWWQLTALGLHLETQPLPTALAWFVHQWPEALLRAATALVLVLELGLPLLIVLPRYLRLVAAAGIAVLQVSILLTGNYNFLNLLVLLLCVFLLDDAWWGRVRRQVIRPLRRWQALVAAALVSVLVTVGATHIIVTFRQRPPPQPWLGLIRLTQPLFAANRYGLFAVMTASRREIVIEGSDNGVEWREYRLAYKPGSLDHSPSWNIPHQPRLDWQLWIAAQERQPGVWFENLLWQLLHNEPAVLALFAENPFPAKPPRYLRARLYVYRYTSAEERARSGNWWQRRLEGEYFPSTRLSEPPAPAPSPRRNREPAETVVEAVAGR